MFGFGRNRRRGLLGTLLGGQRYYQPQRRGLLGGSLGRIAVIGGLGWLGKRLLNNRGNNGGLFGGGNSGYNDPGSSIGGWDDNNSNGQSW